MFRISSFVLVDLSNSVVYSPILKLSNYIATLNYYLGILRIFSFKFHCFQSFRLAK